MMKPAVVIVVSEWPKNNMGGQRGYTFVLSKALRLRQEYADYSLYMLSVSAMTLVELDGIANEDERGSEPSEATLGNWTRRNIIWKAANSQWRILRDLCVLTRQCQAMWQVRRCRRLIASLLHDHGQVILHGHEIGTSYKALQAAAGLDGVMLVHTEHSKGGAIREIVQSYGEAFGKDLNARWMRRQYRMVFEDAKAIVFPGAGALDLFERYGEFLTPQIRERVAVLHSGVHVEASAHVARRTGSCCKLLAVAAHVPEKGIDRMLQAVAECRRRGVELNLRIAGAKTLHSQSLLALSEKLGLTETVQFLGSIPRERILQEMMQADLLLACPLVVVFDLSLLEAMAVGMPVLTTRLEGNIEALGSDYPGFFRNDEELPEVLMRMVTEPALLEQMGASNRARYKEQFTLQALGDRHLQLYSRIHRALAEKCTRERMDSEVVTL